MRRLQEDHQEGARFFQKEAEAKAARKVAVMEAVKQNGHALQYASKELQGDKEVVMEAVKQNGHALQYASKNLKVRPGVTLKVRPGVTLNALLAKLGGHQVLGSGFRVRKIGDGVALAYASKESQGDKEVVMAAHASKELQGDKEVVMEAVKQKGYALAYASKELQGDKEVVMEAVKHGGYALGDASVINFS